jgi:hypothetical protein
VCLCRRSDLSFSQSDEAPKARFIPAGGSAHIVIHKWLQVQLSGSGLRPGQVENGEFASRRDAAKIAGNLDRVLRQEGAKPSG